MTVKEHIAARAIDDLTSALDKLARLRALLQDSAQAEAIARACHNPDCNRCEAGWDGIDAYRDWLMAELDKEV